jgi:hypothetical protein
MKNKKMSFNMILIVVACFSAIAFFFTVKLVNMADRFPVNSFNRIEGTNFAIKYSSIEPDGLYEGDENTCELRVEGTFGYDWGSAVEGDYLYTNEYSVTTLGITVPQLVRINLKDFSKEVLLENTLLRGRCASGELVCQSNYIMPSNYPDTNPLCRLYAMSSDIKNVGSRFDIIYINPQNSQIEYTLENQADLGNKFELNFLEKTLEEVKK